MKKLFYTLPVFLILILFLSSCSKNDTSVPTGGSGTGYVTQTYSSNPNKPIAANDWTNDSLNANLSFGINAQNVSDIKLNLSSLEGVTVSNLRFALVHRGIEVFVIDTPLTVSGSGNMTGTVLSDSGLVSINSGNYPFTGKFRPQVPLTSFINSDPTGFWTLKIYNSGSFRTGVIKSWSITITYSPQIQLPSLDNRYMPVLGDNHKFNLCDTNNVNPGNGGDNVTWDFSSVITHPFEYSDEYVEPIVSPMFWHFPQSNLALRNYDLHQNNLTFYNVNKNSGSFLVYGNGDSTSSGIDIFEFLNPLICAKGITFTYNTTYLDSGRLHRAYGSSVNATGVYSDSVSGDGWGTIRLPRGVTYNNVLRQKIIIATRDTTNGTSITYTMQKIYSWYAVGYRYPVFRIQTDLKYSQTFGFMGSKQVLITTQNVPVSKK